MRGRIVEGDQVDHTVLGTCRSCILKVLLLAITEYCIASLKNRKALTHAYVEGSPMYAPVDLGA